MLLRSVPREAAARFERDEEAIYEEEHASNGRKEERALPTRGGSGDELFRVVGYVDAVSPENDDSIVIEVKNRMHQVRAPELYDKLQVVTYLQMLGWSRGDLVQRIKDPPTRTVRWIAFYEAIIVKTGLASFFLD